MFWPGRYLPNREGRVARRGLEQEEVWVCAWAAVPCTVMYALFCTKPQTEICSVPRSFTRCLRFHIRVASSGCNESRSHVVPCFRMLILTTAWFSNIRNHSARPCKYLWNVYIVWGQVWTCYVTSRSTRTSWPATRITHSPQQNSHAECNRWGT